MKPLYIGNDAYIDSNTVFCIMSAWHPKVRKFVAQAKKENNFLDFTVGKGRVSIIILNTGSIIASTMSSEDIIDSIKS